MKESERVNILEKILFSGTITPIEFEWEQLSPDVNIYQLLTQEDIDYMKNIITSPRYAGNSRLRLSKLDEVMKFRNFIKFAGGTNRIVYTHPSAPNMVFKVAVDAVGIRDNPSEYYNQKLLKPFCTKVFQCSSCGTIASFQKVDRITSEEEFFSIIDDYVSLLEVLIDGKHIYDDIGTKYFMNYGIWKGKGLVILDFPYMYEIDGKKLICKNILDDGSICNGDIDYDKGFNTIICTKCGRIYRAGDLAKTPESGSSITKMKGAARMKFSLRRGDKVIKTFETGNEVEYIVRKESNTAKKNEKNRIYNNELIKVKKVIKTNNETINSVEIPKNKANTESSTTNDKNSKEESVKKVVKTIGVNLKKEKENKKSINGINTELIKVKKKIKTDSFKKYKVKTINNKKKNILEEKTEKPKEKDTVIERIIKVSLDDNINNATKINTKKDNTVKSGVIKVNKTIAIPESEIKRFSNKPSLISSENKDNSVVIEEEKQEIINNSKPTEEIKEEQIENCNESMPISTKSEDQINTESTDIEDKDINNDNDNKDSSNNFYYVKFLNHIPDKSEIENDYIYAIYKGSENFKDHIEYIEDIMTIDRNLYDIYGSFDNKLYLIDNKYDEDGNLIFLVDEDYEENNIDDEKDIDNDIIENIKKSGKPSINDIL